MGQISWGGRTFSSRSQLATWLRQHGVSYSVWAQRHPAAAANLENRSSIGVPGTQTQPPPGVQPGDWQGMIQNEPIGVYQRGQLEAQNAAEAAQRAAAVKALIARYGAVPQGVPDPYGDLSGLGGLPQENAYSTLAQIAKQFQEARGNNTAALAARGVLSSGETGLREQDIGYQRGQAEYNALNDLMQQIGGIDTQYAQGAADRAQQLAQIYQDSMQRAIDAGMSPQQAAQQAAKYAQPPDFSKATQYTPGQSGSGVYSTFAPTHPGPKIAARIAAGGTTATPLGSDALLNRLGATGYTNRRELRGAYLKPGTLAAARGMSLGTVPNNRIGAEMYPALFR